MNTLDETNDETPFVNEECGDTMWDDVLAEKDQQEAEQRLVTPSELRLVEEKVQP